MKRFASIPLKFASACGKIRNNNDIDAAVDDDQLWLRFSAQNDPLEHFLREIPYCRFYKLMEDESRLIEDGYLVPGSRLKIENWYRLKTFFELKPPELGAGDAAIDIIKGLQSGDISQTGVSDYLRNNYEIVEEDIAGDWRPWNVPVYKKRVTGASDANDVVSNMFDQLGE